MAPRTLASRSAIALLAAITALAPPAAAQSGSGLYEPFPDAAVKKRAQRYVERLGSRTEGDVRRFSDAELAAGVFVRPDARGPALRPPAAGAHRSATARAGSGDARETALALQLLVLVAALALAAAAVSRRMGARAA